MKCDGLIAQGINQSCGVRLAGYESRAIIINKEDIDTITYGATRGSNVVTGITLKTNKNGYVVKQYGKPFNGTKTEAVVGDYGNTWRKTVQFVHAEVGSAAACDINDALLDGEFVMLLENKEKSGDGAFEIIGLETGLKLASAVKDNSVTGARWNMSIVEEGCRSSEIVFFNTSYATTKAAFEALLPE